MEKTTLAIIGTGPAGYTASIYASRYKIDNILIGELVGGQASEAHKMCNFPSYEEVNGMELMQRFQSHAKNLGAKEILAKATKIEGSFGNFTIHLSNGEIVESKLVLLAIGVKRRELGLADEAKYLGKGVSYCVTCDAMFYQGKVVAVVGGSDAANTGSLRLAEVAEKVYQIYRRDKLRGEPTWAEAVTKNPKIEVIYNTNVVGLDGGETLEELILDQDYNDSKSLKVDGLFVEIGSEPDKTFPDQLGVETDQDGYIKVNPDQSTDIKGILAAGDITTASNKFKQVITAAAEGAIAIETAFGMLQ